MTEYNAWLADEKKSQLRFDQVGKHKISTVFRAGQLDVETRERQYFETASYIDGNADDLIIHERSANYEEASKAHDAMVEFYKSQIQRLS